MIAVIQAVVNRVKPKRFLSATAYSAVEYAVHKLVSEPLIVDAVAEEIGRLSLVSSTRGQTISSTRSKNCLERAKIQRLFVKLEKAVKKKKIKVGDGITI